MLGQDDEQRHDKIMRDFKLVALVHPDAAAVTADNISGERLEEIMQENKGILNKSVASYEKISSIEITNVEFEKTPKKSIKRFLYS